MSNDTSSTAWTSPRAPPPKMDSPRGKILVRLRISTRGTRKMVPARQPRIFTDLIDQALKFFETNNRYSSADPSSTLSPCDHRHGQQRREHAQSFPASELLFEDEARQQHGNCGIK